MPIALHCVTIDLQWLTFLHLYLLQHMCEDVPRLDSSQHSLETPNNLSLHPCLNMLRELGHSAHLQ